MSVISKPIFHFVGWYFEQLFNHPLRTKAVTRFVVRQIRVTPSMITLSPFQLRYRIIRQLCIPEDVQ